MQCDRRIGQQTIDLSQRASHHPATSRADRERGAATVRTSAEAAEVGVGYSQAQLGGGAVVGQIGIGHADRHGADQALQACGHALAQAHHGADGWHTAEYGWIIHRRHGDRGTAEVQAGATCSQIKVQGIVAIGRAGGREVENSTGLQIAVESANRAHKGQLGAVAPRHGDTRAVAGAEAAAGGAALAHGERQRLQRLAAIEIGQHQGAQVERRRGVFRGGDRSWQVGEGGGVIDCGHRNGEAGRGSRVRKAAAVVGRHLDLTRRGVGGIGTVGKADRPQGGLEVGRGGRAVNGGLNQQRTTGGVVGRG